MHKTIIALIATASIAGAGVALPKPAEAHAWWVVPAIVAAGVGGGIVIAGAVVADDTRPYATGGRVYVQPYGTQCYLERRETPQGWRNVQVCY